MEVLEETFQSQRVSEWVIYSQTFQSTLKNGDLIEINMGAYSHWSMYYVQGLVIHFTPTNAEERVHGDTFVPGQVTLCQLEDVAGDSVMRVNNKLDFPAPVRCLTDTDRLINILPSGRGFFYSRNLFNCEMFVTYLKFEGPPDSSLRNLIVAIETGSLGKLRGEDSAEIILKKLAYLQWWENTCKTFHKDAPRKLLEQGISEWDGE